MIPMRVDCAGGWLDVPEIGCEWGGYVVNCAIRPGLVEYPWQHGGGVGGSAAAAIAAMSRGATGRDPWAEELARAGWQDPAVILETGLCIWRAGATPHLLRKPPCDFLRGRMAAWWTGTPHDTAGTLCRPRDYSAIFAASVQAALAACAADFSGLSNAVWQTYHAQLGEGMARLPEVTGACSRKYLGAGWGGYALYLFYRGEARDAFCREQGGIAIEPFERDTT